MHSLQIDVPIEYHSNFIGRKGESVRELMSTFAVRIKIPSPEENSEEIVVTGTAENVEACLENIRERVADLDKQADDRKLRSYAVKFEVPLKYHQRLIGPGGAKIREISARHDVQITIPRSDNPSETITVTGYETNANACKDEIEEMVRELETMFTMDIRLDPRFHPRLIGQRGRNLRKVECSFFKLLLKLVFRSKMSTKWRLGYREGTIQIRRLSVFRENPKTSYMIVSINYAPWRKTTFR